MTNSNEAIGAYIAALTDPGEASLAALGRWLAEDVTVAGLVGAAASRSQLLEVLAAPNATRLVATATWTDPLREGNETVVDARLAPGMNLAGVRFAFSLDKDGLITHVGQQMLPAPPAEPRPLAIGAEWKEAIDGALANGTPVIVAYVDAAGAPHLAPRGSVQVLDEQRIGIWVRDPEGGILKGIQANPTLALYYRDPKTRATFTITGRARVATDQATRETIYVNQPAVERNFDGRRRGAAIVVDVDYLEAGSPAGRVRMARGAREG